MSHPIHPLVLADDLQHQLGYLFASIAILGFAPLLGVLGRRSPRITASIDVAVSLATVALVGLAVLPECVEIAGSPALLAALAGLLLPALFERRLHAFARGFTAWLAALALAVHSMTDGFAIAGAHAGHGHGHGLELAVILHQLPFSAALWWFLRPRGRAIAIGALSLVAVATIVGFGLGLTAVSVVGEHGALFQAFAGGMVMHVLLHRPVARAVDAVIPWALAAFFCFAAIEALILEPLRALPVAIGLVALGFVFVYPRLERLALLPQTRLSRGSGVIDERVRRAHRCRGAQSTDVRRM
jgi:hypothetical protein